ncbi:MAG TPA: hypothetical protein VGJ08_07560 [Rhizomicrobium sp.]
MAHRYRSAFSKSLAVAAVVASACFATTSVGADQLKLPSGDGIDYSVLSNQPLRLWTPHEVGTPSTEHPAADFTGSKLDFADGQLQLFRFRLDKVPFDTTLPRQQISAGGIKLKWTW